MGARASPVLAVFCHSISNNLSATFQQPFNSLSATFQQPFGNLTGHPLVTRSSLGTLLMIYLNVKINKIYSNSVATGGGSSLTYYYILYI